jgi:hypothetical protein
MITFIKKILILISALTIAAITMVAVFAIINQLSDSALLRQIALVQPGVKLDSIKGQLDKEMGVVTNPDEMVRLGSVKDRSFCEGKKLHRIPVGRTGGELSVYTDQNDTVVYVTWLQE